MHPAYEVAVPEQQLQLGQLAVTVVVRLGSGAQMTSGHGIGPVGQVTPGAGPLTVVVEQTSATVAVVVMVVTYEVTDVTRGHLLALQSDQKYVCRLSVRGSAGQATVKRNRKSERGSLTQPHLAQLRSRPQHWH